MIRKKKNKNGTTKYEAKVKRNGRTLSRRFDSEREASHWVNEVRYKRDNNLPLSAPVSIQVMFDKYLEYAKNRGRAGSTLKDYRGHFKNHLLPFYRQIEMKTVTVEEHEELVRLLVKKGLSAATCNRIRSLMSVIYSTAIKKRFFCGACGALDEQRRIAADRRCEMLAHPGFGRARYTEQQQRTVSGERRNGDFNQALLADVLG